MLIVVNPAPMDATESPSPPKSTEVESKKTSKKVLVPAIEDKIQGGKDQGSRKRSTCQKEKEQDSTHAKKSTSMETGKKLKEKIATGSESAPNKQTQ